MAKNSEAQRVALLVFLKALRANAKQVGAMLEEGHHEAAGMLQTQFVEQFEEAYSAAKEILEPTKEEVEEKPSGQGISNKRK